MMNNAAKSFDILAAILSIIHNYFNGPKLFSDLYLAKFLDISTKLFFSCKIVHLEMFNYMFILINYIYFYIYKRNSYH